MKIETVHNFAPASGKEPQALVVLLHGYGANGQDLISLAPAWAGILPEAEFIAPDAPAPCEMAPFGRQWFSLADRNPQAMLAGVSSITTMVNDFIDDALTRRGLNDSQLALVGFSQGTMTALYTGLRRAKACAGILGFSGAFLGGDLAGEITARPPVMLVHGTDDPVVPFAAMEKAQADLQRLDIDIRTLERPGLPHGIDEAGMVAGADFLAEILTGKTAATATTG